MPCREMITRLVLVLAVSVASLAICRSVDAQQQTEFLRVNGDAGALPPPAGTADGSTWAPEKAFRFLQDAITTAEFLAQNPNVTVEIWVAATAATNPYRPDENVNSPGGNLDPNTTFSMHNRIHQYGGFLGLGHPTLPDGETQRSQRNPEVNITVLSGLLMFCGEPGALPCNEPHPGIPGCADAACCELVCSQLPLCCLSGPGLGWTQTCVDAAAACGGTAGVDLQAYHVVTADGVGPSARLSGFTVTHGGDAGYDGGGLSVTSASPVVARCRFTENVGGIGGAVQVDAFGASPGHATLVNCAFDGNHANEGGAVALHSGNGQVRLVNCLFAENSATLEGGAIKAFGASQSALEARNCTFTANSVEPPGVGGAISLKSNGPVTITNCILWGDSPVNDEIHTNPGAPVVSDSDVEGGFAGMGNINVPPLFVGVGNYRLSASSPCIDEGNNPDVQLDTADVDDDGVTTGEYAPDLDLQARIRKGTLGGCPEGVVDMGAYEFIPAGCPADCGGDVPDGVVDTVDFLLLLQQWGQQCTSCDIMHLPGVDTVDFLELLQHWGPCGAQQASSPPKTVLDCYERYGFDAQLLAHCICAVAPCTEGCPPEGCN